MGVVSDAFRHNFKYGFILTTIFAGLLFLDTVLNLVLNLTEQRLAKLDKIEY
jgi:hypothetical protein